MRASLAAAALLAVSLAAAAPARAADAPSTRDPDPLAPAAVQAAIRGWLANLLGPSVTLPDQAITVVREGDHDRLQVQADAISFGLLTADKPIATATIRPGSATGTWAIEDIVSPSPQRLHLHLQGSRADLATMTITTAGQAAHALVDTTGQGESSSQSNLRGVDTLVDSRAGHQVQHTDTLAAQSRLRPGADGRVDLMQMVDGAGFTSAQTAPNGDETHITAARFHLAGHIDGLDPSHAGPALQAALRLQAARAAAPAPTQAGVIPAPSTSTNPDPGHPDAGHPGDFAMPAIDRLAARDLLAALPGLVGALQVEQSADTITVTLGRNAVSMAHLGLGMAASAPDNLLQARLDLALDGLSVPTLPKQFGDLVPRHLEFRPTVQGLNLLAVMALAQAALADPDTKTDLSSLASHDLFGPAGLVAGIDSISFDVGPATLSGVGRMTMRPDHTLHGLATLTVVGYDALMTRAGNTPALKQAVPVFILAKGLGRQEGDHMVWDLAYEDGRTTVNGTDLSAMIPGGAPPPAAPKRLK